MGRASVGIRSGGGGGCIPGDLEKIKAGGEERRNFFLFLFMIICKERRKKPDEGER